MLDMNSMGGFWSTVTETHQASDQSQSSPRGTVYGEKAQQARMGIDNGSSLHYLVVEAEHTQLGHSRLFQGIPGVLKPLFFEERHLRIQAQIERRENTSSVQMHSATDLYIHSSSRPLLSTRQKVGLHPFQCTIC